jgi:hypothetical protein
MTSVTIVNVHPKVKKLPRHQEIVRKIPIYGWVPVKLPVITCRSENGA